MALVYRSAPRVHDAHAGMFQGVRGVRHTAKPCTKPGP